MARKPLPRTSLAEAITLDQGETLHGYYRRSRVANTEHGENQLHEFELIDPIASYKAGRRVALWGSVVLDDLMQSATIHAESWITFQGVKGRTKVYKMEQDPDKTTPPKPAEEGDPLPEDVPF